MTARVLSFLMALAFVGSLGFAQTAPTPSSPPIAAEQYKAPLTRDGKPRAKEVRTLCREEAKMKGLKPREQPFRDHMKACIGKQRPDLVKAYECRQEARDKKIDKAEIRDYVKTCKAKS